MLTILIKRTNNTIKNDAIIIKFDDNVIIFDAIIIKFDDKNRQQLTPSLRAKNLQPPKRIPNCQ